MKRHCLLLGLLAITPAFASNVGFGLDAFNRAISAATRGNAVFSPVSFELDCVVVSEAFGAITRAKFAETMGVLNGLESVYVPIHEELSKGVQSFTLISARAFCLPDERKANSVYRQWLQKTFSAEAFTFGFKKGAECWFRARLDGKAEDFSLPDNAASTGYYSYYDLVYFRCPLNEAVPSNCVTMTTFRREDGKDAEVLSMRVNVFADFWQRKKYTIIRLPLANDTWFFALTPIEGVSIREIRNELSSCTFTDTVHGIKSITESTITHCQADVSMPIIDIVTESDLKLPFGYFRFPMTGMERIQEGVQPRFFRQRVRFQLDEKGTEHPVAQATNDEPRVDVPVTTEQRSISLNRPFLFFVYHEPTVSIPVAGQFMGK